jgi:uncharacterized protein YegL
MNQNLTEIAFILDRSGSMAALADEAIGAFNSFLNVQKEQPGERRFTLAIFDHEYGLEHDGKNVQEVPELNRGTYTPRGTTALLDAIGRTLDHIGQKLSKTPEEDRPAKVIVAILTDGLDNASRDYSKAKVDEMIQHQRDRYAWNFQFLAASQDAIVTTIGRTVDVELLKSLDRLAAAIVLYLILVCTVALLWESRRLQKRHHLVLTLSPFNEAWNRPQRGEPRTWPTFLIPLKKWFVR